MASPRILDHNTHSHTHTHTVATVIEQIGHKATSGPIRSAGCVSQLGRHGHALEQEKNVRFGAVKRGTGMFGIVESLR